MNRELVDIVRPLKVMRFSTCEYSEVWVEGIRKMFAAQYAFRGNVVMPHCGVLSLSAGKVEGLFDVKKESNWVLEVSVFRSLGEMSVWISDVGPERINFRHLGE